jgi:membrane protein DedA with SNARE-associated domain
MGLIYKLISALIIFPVTLFIGFIIDTEILGHVEGFKGIYYSIPIAIVLTLLTLLYVLYKHIKDKRFKKDRV